MLPGMDPVLGLGAAPDGNENTGGGVTSTAPG